MFWRSSVRYSTTGYSSRELYKVGYSIRYCTKGNLQPTCRKVFERVFYLKFFKVCRGVFYKVVVRLFFLVPDFLRGKPLPNKLRFNW